MWIYLAFLSIISCIGIKFFIKEFNKDYLSKDNTDCIKGIFVLIVFYSHLMQYISFDTFDISNWFVKTLGQLMVTMFLFYSGYGIYESIKKNGNDYIKKIPRNRIIVTLFNFDIAILTFLGINYIFGKTYPLKRILLSFIGWESVGNSNWYIFGILFLYLFTYLSFRIFKGNDKRAITLNLILTVIFSIVLSKLLPYQTWWYNTLLCYPLGLIYSFNKDKINSFLFNNKNYAIILPLLFIVFIIFYHYLRDSHWILYDIISILFSLIVILLTMKIKINNKFLKWCGNNLFWLYILQRVPMLVLNKLHYTNLYGYIIICFISMLVLAYIYSKVFTIIDKKIKRS